MGRQKARVEAVIVTQKKMKEFLIRGKSKGSLIGEINLNPSSKLLYKYRRFHY